MRCSLPPRQHLGLRSPRLSSAQAVDAGPWDGALGPVFRSSSWTCAAEKSGHRVSDLQRPVAVLGLKEKTDVAFKALFL